MKNKHPLKQYHIDPYSHLFMPLQYSLLCDTIEVHTKEKEMEWLVEFMTGEVTWIGLAFFMAINNVLLRRIVKRDIEVRDIEVRDDN